MAEAEGRGGWLSRLRRSIRQIGPVRLVITLVFLVAGTYLARYDWHVPLLSDAERALYDLRFATEARVVDRPDDRIVLVVYNDETLRQLGKRSPLDRRMLARALTVLDSMRPRAIGIDILFDQPQAEDSELIGAFRAMRTPTFLAFASHAANPDQMEDWQEAFLTDFQRQVASGPVRPASIKLEPDLQDGVMRRWTRADPRLPPLLSNAMIAANPHFRSYDGALDFTVPATPEIRRFPKMSIEEIAALDELPAEARDIVLAQFSRQIAGRYILIGGDIHDQDDFETPMTRFGQGWTKGIEVHAQMLAQQLDGRMPAPISPWLLWLAAILAVVAGALTSALELRGWRLGAALIVQVAIIAWLPFQLQAMQMNTLGLPAFGWGAGWLFAFIGAGAAARAVGSEERRFAQ